MINYEQDLKDYFKAMKSYDSEICYAIEQRHGLDGYPPEIVTLALEFAAKAMQETIVADIPGGWIDANIEHPPLLDGEDYSLNVWGWDGTALMVVSFFDDSDGWHWANAYGNIFGDAEFDDDYDVLFWQNIIIPEPPLTTEGEN